MESFEAIRTGNLSAHDSSRFWKRGGLPKEGKEKVAILVCRGA